MLTAKRVIIATICGLIFGSRGDSGYSVYRFNYVAPLLSHVATACPSG